MHAWPEELLSLSNAIRNQATLPEAMAVCPHYPPSSALDIYRNNYRENLHDALAAAYPILLQLVGADFFRLVALTYIKQYSSQSGNLHGYGEQMPDFLAHFAAARELPYLPDVTRLEWACHRAYYARDCLPFDAMRLSSLAEIDQANLVWKCHPAFCMLHSPYPLLAIWQAHQPGANEDFHINLDRGGGDVMVSRHMNEVTVQSLTPVDASWIRHIQTGATFGAATHATLAIHPDFDLSATLSHLIANEVLIDFH